MPSRGIWQTLHFKQANLVQATSEDIHDVTIVGGTLGEVVVILRWSSVVCNGLAGNSGFLTFKAFL